MKSVMHIFFCGCSLDLLLPPFRETGYHVCVGIGCYSGTFIIATSVTYLYFFPFLQVDSIKMSEDASFSTPCLSFAEVEEKVEDLDVYLTEVTLKLQLMKG